MYPYDWVRERNLKRYEFRGSSRNFEHYGLRHSDPGKVLWLMSILWDSSIISMEMKINEYLQNGSNSTLGFIVHEATASNEMVVCVLGLKEVAPDISILDSEYFWFKIKNANCPVLITKINYFPERLKVEIERYLKENYTEEFINAVIFPIYFPSITEPVFFYVLVNCGATTNIAPNYGLLNECFRFCGPLVITTFSYNEEICHTKGCKAVVDTCIETLPHLDSLKSFWEVVKTEMSHAFNTEEVMVYFCKHIDEYHTNVIDFDFAPNSPENDSTDIFPYQFGLEGKMLKHGRFLNTLAPKKHVYLSKYLKKHSKIKLRNLMTFPLIYKGVSNGIIEVFNKESTEIKFSKADEDYAKCIGLILGTFVHQAFKFSVSKDRQDRYNYVNCQNLRRIPVEKISSIEKILKCKDEHKYQGLLEFTFLPSTIPKEHTVCILMGMYQDLGVVNAFEINEYNLVSFLETLHLGYMNQPFHNWEHAFSTTHFLFVLIKNFAFLKNGYTDHIEILAILTAAICHDIDFRGPTTPFQNAAGTTLGSLYGTPGKIKQHHAVSQVLQILCRPICNIAQNMTTEQFKVFIYLLEEYILDIDLTSFVRKIDILTHMCEFESFDKTNLEHKKLFNILIMTTAHLSEYVKSKEYVDLFTRHQCDEFFRPEKSGIYKGVFDMTDLNLTQVKSVALQVQFMDTIVLPAFEILYILFPTTYNCLSQVQQHADSWKAEMERFAKPGTRITPPESLISSLSAEETAEDILFR